MPTEADSRIVIDRKLHEAGWNIEDANQVATEEPAADGRADYRVANVQRGFLALDEIKEIGLLDSEYERVKLAKGDLLLVEGNGNPKEVGRAAVWNGSIEVCVHQNHLIRVRPQNDLLTSEYLLAFVNSESGRRYFHSAGNTTSGLSTITTRAVPEKL
jgi:type I restriction enzyme S subunit